MVGLAGAVLIKPQLKVCGLRQVEQAAAIAALGVDAIGVIAVPSSPRFVPVADRPALFKAARAARSLCRGVLVVADPGEADLVQLHPSHGHQVVQLHGAETPERCRELRQRLDGAELWKALRIRTPEDLDQVQHYATVVDAVLLDAWVPGVLGGTGHRIPIEWLETLHSPLPWWLAGGISAATAAATLERLQPGGLDASSALELSPGVKDLQRVHELVAVVAAARQDQGQ